MDFRKVENIFIIAFIILNLYLLFSYLNRYDLQSATTNSNQVDVLEVMEQSNIELPEFQNNDPIVYSMQADQENLLEEEAADLDEQAGSVTDDGAYYNSFLSDPIELEGNVQDGYTEEDFLSIENFLEGDRVLFGENYDYGFLDTENNRLVYYQNVNNLPVADGTSEISLYVNSNGDIFSYQQTFAGPMTEQGEPLNIITNQAAVEILFQNNEITSNSTVYEPTLSYQRSLNLEDLSMYSPVWLVHIETNGGTEIHRVNARDGQILPEPTDSTMQQAPEDAEDENEEAEEESSENNSNNSE